LLFARTMSNTTSIGLLDRLKHARSDAPDWRRLNDIYLPYIRSWLLREGGIDEEIDDLAQEVLIVVIRELPAFERRRHGSFRAWLRQITVNRIRAFWKARQLRPRAGKYEEVEQFLSQLADSDSALAKQWDRDHDQHVLQKLLALVQADFEPNTWQAFVRVALEGQPTVDVAQELKMSESAVVQAKFRILKRLREEAGEMID
jgi:RNA polymerase sigma-70 factor (ECF subfamily)